MFITLSDISGQSLFVIPIVPPDVNIQEGGENETVNTVGGNVRLVGDEVLTEISWSSIFPVFKNNLSVAIGSLPNGYDYVDFIKSTIKQKIPIRITITSAKKRPIKNILATIDTGFSYNIDTAGDIRYSIKLTEFPASKWDYINGSPNLKKYISNLAIQSVAKKALSKVGLI